MPMVSLKMKPLHHSFINRPFYWCAVIGGPRDGVRHVYNVSDCQTALMQQSTAAYGPNENITTEVLAKAKHAEEHCKLYCNSQSGKDRDWIHRARVEGYRPVPWTSLAGPRGPPGPSFGPPL